MHRLLSCDFLSDLKRIGIGSEDIKNWATACHVFSKSMHLATAMAVSPSRLTHHRHKAESFLSIRSRRPDRKRDGDNLIVQRCLLRVLRCISCQPMVQTNIFGHKGQSCFKYAAFPTGKVGRFPAKPCRHGFSIQAVAEAEKEQIRSSPSSAVSHQNVYPVLYQRSAVWDHL